MGEKMSGKVPVGELTGRDSSGHGMWEEEGQGGDESWLCFLPGAGFPSAPTHPGGRAGVRVLSSPSSAVGHLLPLHLPLALGGA